MADKSLTDIYNSQKRGELSDYDRYLAGMDKTMQQKLAFTGAHFLLQPGAVIADMGCGSGLGSFQFAQLNPHIRVVGIDINPDIIQIAREKYKLPNLSFEIGDIESPDPKLGPFDGILNSSVLHHVYTFNNYDRAHVVNALKNQFDNLTTGGTMIIRDFVAWPEDEYVLLDVKAAPRGEGTGVKDMSDADLLVLFSKTAKPLNPEKGSGFFVEEMESADADFRRFRLSAKWANEFILRKDYRTDWDVETLEEYSWWTKEEYAKQLTELGGRVVYTAPFWNSWIIENRFRDQLRIFKEDGTPMDFPPTNFVAVCEKVAPGESLNVGERLISQSEKNFLELTSFKKDSGEVFDMAKRPGNVWDVLPYRLGGAEDDNRLYIFAKHGYPRPLANAVPRGTPSLDAKKWSGHMIEPIAFSVPENDAGTIVDTLAARANINRRDLGALETGINYYPCPGLTDELVTSGFVRVDREASAGYVSETIDPSVSGFSTSGDVRAYAAQDILRAAQVGILPEARMEMNIYRLLQHLGQAPDAWLGSEMVKFTQEQKVEAEDLGELLAEKPHKAFTKLADFAGDYISHLRSGFSDISAEKENGRQEFEFIIPKNGSTNVASVLPMVRGADGEMYVGLREIDLPTPQNKEGNSRIFVAPSFRLPNSVTSIDKAAAYAGAKLGITSGDIRKLGEGYFSSIGTTPERVFPLIAEVDPAQLKEKLHFVPLSDLFKHADALRDAPLMISAFRSVHALGLWNNLVLDPQPKTTAKAQQTPPKGPKP